MEETPKEETKNEEKPEETKKRPIVRLEAVEFKPKLRMVKKKKPSPKPEWWQLSTSKAIIGIIAVVGIIGILWMIVDLKAGVVVMIASMVIAMLYVGGKTYERSNEKEFQASVNATYSFPNWNSYLYTGKDDIIRIQIKSRGNTSSGYTEIIDMERDIFLNYILENKKFHKFVNHNPEILKSLDENDPTAEIEV